MKKLHLLIFLGFIAGYSTAQKWTIPTDIVKMYIANDKLSEVDNLDLTIAVEETNEGFYKFTVTYADSSPQHFQLKPLELESFIGKAKLAFEKVFGEIGNKPAEQKDIDKYLNELYTIIAVYLRTDEETPQVATVSLVNSEVNTYYDFSKDSVKLSITSLNITNVNLTFYNGFIEKVQVLGSIQLKDNKTIPIEFNNKFSIGISSTLNVKNLSKISMYSDKEFSRSFIKSIVGKDMKALTEQQVLTGKGDQSLYITLGDFLNYEKTLDVNANDISPAPITVNLSSENPKQKLFREKTTQLFEAKLYTDLLGLIDEENPNGIVQLELDKRFNFLTTRTDCRRGGIGGFQYIDAIFNLSKIEADNKYLIPPLFSDSLNLPVFHPIQLYQYRNYSVGAMLNLVNYENQNIKYNFIIDLGLLFGRTGIKTDTTEFANKFFINNMEIPFETGFHFIPEKRVKLIISDRISWFKQLSDDIELPLNDDGKTKTAAWLNTVAMKLEVNISDNGKLFARYKFTHEIGEWQNNFSQLQFGYSFYILKNNGVNKVISNN